MKYRGLIICGTHNPRLEDMGFFLKRIKDAREKKIPFLGICYGHQLAAIEYAKNVLGIKDATSEEFKIKGTYIVRKLPKIKVGGYFEGETRWNNYEVELEGWKNPEWFFTTQAHPEYQSSIDKPHPFLKEFLNYARTAMEM